MSKRGIKKRRRTYTVDEETERRLTRHQNVPASAQLRSDVEVAEKKEIEDGNQKMLNK
jgi:hypothetical protein